MFRKQLSAKQVNIHHLKILCLKNGLDNVRKCMDAVPESLIKVKSPFKVQTGSDTWTNTRFKRNDGTQVV